MTIKRFTIQNSAIVQDGYFIKDEMGSFSFPTTTDGSDLIMYQKVLNELYEDYSDAVTTLFKVKEENEFLKQQIKEVKSSD